MGRNAGLGIDEATELLEIQEQPRSNIIRPTHPQKKERTMGTITLNGKQYAEIAAPSNEVIVRTFSAGVHVGTIKEKDGKRVILTNARRIWKWSGAFTLNAVATSGINRQESRISCSVPEIELTEAIEIIPVVSGVNLTTTESE